MLHPKASHVLDSFRISNFPAFESECTRETHEHINLIKTFCSEGKTCTRGERDESIQLMDSVCVCASETVLCNAVTASPLTS